MSTDRYSISSPLVAKDQLHRVMAQAMAEGQFELAVQAGEWLIEELARTPLELGESRDVLPHLNLKVRLAFVRPIAVQFAVHEESKQVFVRGFAYCGTS